MDEPGIRFSRAAAEKSAPSALESNVDEASGKAREIDTMGSRQPVTDEVRSPSRNSRGARRRMVGNSPSPKQNGSATHTRRFREKRQQSKLDEPIPRAVRPGSNAGSVAASFTTSNPPACGSSLSAKSMPSLHRRARRPRGARLPCSCRPPRVGGCLANRSQYVVGCDLGIEERTQIGIRQRFSPA